VELCSFQALGGTFATAGGSVISRRRDARLELNLIKTSAFSTAHTQG